LYGLNKVFNRSYENVLDKMYNVVNISESNSKYLNGKCLNKILSGRYPKEDAGKFLNEFQKKYNMYDDPYNMDQYIIRTNKLKNVVYQFHKPY